MLTTLNCVTKPFVLNKRLHSSHQEKTLLFGNEVIRDNVEVSYQKLYGSKQYWQTWLP
ncbi:hypothetical protein [Candidatus Enterovibrio altilux]|uniref:Uncharacterized protein n=1 Tax=Candidatus Enterovibrio altilux TaxID=1927128 RepID=A0A291BBN5_9GAMM|nr:hypothetical protein BTN50_1950 [Candidatus Enterovibrio luxaltus]